MTAKRTWRSEGVTLIELLITVTIGVVILGLTFSIVMSNRELMTRDQIDTELNQNLRIGADILGDDIRIAGQGILIPNPNMMPLRIQNNQIVIRNREVQPSGIVEVQQRTYWLEDNILWLRVSRSLDGITFVDGPDQGVINKVRAMNVSTVLQNGSADDKLDTPAEWSNLREVRIQLIGATDIRGKTHTSELTSSFFPRNVLSR